MSIKHFLIYFSSTHILGHTIGAWLTKMVNLVNLTGVRIT
jgi:hypothetical protein